MSDESSPLPISSKSIVILSSFYACVLLMVSFLQVSPPKTCIQLCFAPYLIMVSTYARSLTLFYISSILFTNSQLVARRSFLNNLAIYAHVPHLIVSVEVSRPKCCMLCENLQQIRLAVFMVTPCTNEIKCIIVQLMHSNIWNRWAVKKQLNL